MFYQYQKFYKVVSKILRREILNDRQMEKEMFTAEQVRKIAFDYHDEMVTEELTRSKRVFAIIAVTFGIIIGISFAYGFKKILFS